MKKLKYITLILTIALVSASCESYDDYPEDRPSYVGFARLNMNINGVGDTGSTKTAEVELFISDASTSDRTFTITDVEIDDPEDFPPTDRENFDYETSVTIPAGERKGVLTVTGINTTLSSNRTFFRLSIVDDNPSVLLGAASTITIGLRK